MENNTVPPTVASKRLSSKSISNVTASSTKVSGDSSTTAGNNAMFSNMISTASSSNINREDPWPQMEKQVSVMLNDLSLQRERFREMANPTVISENELLESIAGCQEAVQDMRFALDTAMEHPESFAISTDELQSRAERVRGWERDMMNAQQIGEKIRAAQRRRLQIQSSSNNNNNIAENSGLHENNEFLQQEHAVQENIMQVDDQTLDRLHSGIHRVKNTAVNITDELNTQEHILNDIDRGMTRAQMRIDGALRKVALLLDKTSDRGKMICIAVLILILIILIFVLLRE